MTSLNDTTAPTARLCTKCHNEYPLTPDFFIDTRKQNMAFLSGAKNAAVQGITNENLHA